MSADSTDPRDGLGTMRLAPQTDDIVVLGLIGQFDMRNASEITRLGDELLEAGKHVILDLGETTFIDSYVIHALTNVVAQAKRSGRVAVLEVGTAAIVERVLELIHVEQIIPRASSRSDAVRTIRQSDASMG